MNPIWSIWPHAAAQLAEQVQNLLAAGITTEQLQVAAGPAEDAEESGLPLRTIGTTAVVELRGVMVKRPGLIERILFGASDTRATQQAIAAAGADEDIERILFLVDTPGGSVDGLAELGDTIAAVAEQKPVIVQVDGTLASAGYYVASQATEIRAGRMDLVGSIGTRTLLYDFSEMFAAEGVKAIPIDTGKFKSAGAIGTEITEEQQADFQRIVDAYFADFRDLVMRGRGFDRKTFDGVADGRVWTAAGEALGLGLIDQVSSLDETVAEIRAASKPRPQPTQARSRFSQAAQALAERL